MYNFLVSDAPMFVTRPSNIAGLPGDRVTLICEVDANPRPSYKWYKLTDDVPIMVGTAANLTLEVSPGTAGKYECVAASKTGHYAAIKAQASIFLKAKPEIETQNRIQKSPMSGTGHVECWAVSVPSVQSVEWYHGGEMIIPSDGSGKYSVQENRSMDSVKSTLIIRKMQETDFADYTCKVTNALGTDVATFTLEQQGKPNKANHFSTCSKNGKIIFHYFYFGNFTSFYWISLHQQTKRKESRSFLQLEDAYQTSAAEL